MSNYFHKLWKQRKSYITSLLLLVVVGFWGLVRNWHGADTASFGIAAGTLLTCVMLFSPVVWVEAKKIKVKNTRPVFVEPKQWQLALLWLATTCVLAVVTIAVLTLAFPGDSLGKILDADGFLSGLIVIAAILTVMFGFITIYMLFIKTRYVRVVEYGTTEWRHLKNENTETAGHTVKQKNKIVKLYGVELERWRIVQGSLIYIVFFILSALGAINHWWRGMLLLLAFCLTTSVAYAYRYRKRVRNKKHLLAVAVVKTVCLPSTAI